MTNDQQLRVRAMELAFSFTGTMFTMDDWMNLAERIYQFFIGNDKPPEELEAPF